VGAGGSGYEVDRQSHTAPKTLIRSSDRAVSDGKLLRRHFTVPLSPLHRSPSPTVAA
jgi:hypothetical protein